MMSDDVSARLALPMLHPGQAQKELYHNEALALLDMIVQPAVISLGVNTPPPAPAAGACWIIGEAPTGLWAGKARQLAGWTISGWRFVVPVDGMNVWLLDQQLSARYVSGNWIIGDVRASRLLIGGQQLVGARLAAIGNPAGGSSIDIEARATLIAVLGALRTHGLIAA